MVRGIKEVVMVTWFSWILEFVPGYLSGVLYYLGLVPWYLGVVPSYLGSVPGYLFWVPVNIILSFVT